MKLSELILHVKASSIGNTRLILNSRFVTNIYLSNRYPLYFTDQSRQLKHLHIFLKGCLAGFIKSRTSYKPHKSGQRIQIPTGYIPKHNFDDTSVLKVKKELNTPGNEKESSKNNRLSSNDRSLLLGEKVQGLEDVNKWALKWDDRTDAQDPLEEHEKSNLPSTDKDETRKSR